MTEKPSITNECPACGTTLEKNTIICPACRINTHYARQVGVEAARAPAPDNSPRAKIKAARRRERAATRQRRAERRAGDRWGWKTWAVIGGFAVIAWAVQQSRDTGRTSSSPRPAISEAAVLDAVKPAFADALTTANEAHGIPPSLSRGIDAQEGTCPQVGDQRYSCRFVEDIRAGNDLTYRYGVRLAGQCFTATMSREPEGFISDKLSARFGELRVLTGCVADG